MTDISEVSEKAKAWPFEQARALLKRLKNMEKQGKSKQGPVVFETGYGPSGLPHIGTFGEVVRTTMVKHAFETLTDGAYETKLICISDDMDGMRKIPPTVPNPEILEPYIQMPLTRVPDPFGTHQSYGEHMGAKLCSFLDRFNFDYEFLSATQCYKDGTFDPMLLRALEKFDEIMAVMLPTLGAERQASYSPFLPISPTTGRVLYVPMKSIDPARGTMTFEDEDGYLAPRRHSNSCMNYSSTKLARKSRKPKATAFQLRTGSPMPRLKACHYFNIRSRGLPKNYFSTSSPKLLMSI